MKRQEGGQEQARKIIDKEQGQLAALQSFLGDLLQSLDRLQNPEKLEARALFKHCFRLLYIVGRTFKQEHHAAVSLQPILYQLLGRPEVIQRFEGLENHMVRAFSSYQGDIKKDLRTMNKEEALLEYLVKNKQDAHKLRNKLQEELLKVTNELNVLQTFVKGMIAVLREIEEKIPEQRAA